MSVLPRVGDPVASAMPERGPARGTLLQCVGLVLMAAAAKLWLIAQFGSDIPYLDQWAGEGSAALHPWLTGGFNWRNLFWPHGEHHPVVARVVALLVFLANGQWDCRVQLLGNVLMFAGFLAALGLWLRRVFTDWRLPVALLAALALVGQPGITENHLWAFQTQFLGVQTFGLLHLLGMAEARGRTGWILGWLAGVVALFTIASGAASAAVLMGVAAVHLWRAPRSRWAWCTLGANAVLVFWGWRLLASAFSTPGGWAGGGGVFFERLTVLLAWPFQHPAAVLLHVPLAVCVIRIVRERGTDRARRLVGIFGLWCWALTLCLAVGRNNGYGAVASRYWDILATGLLANGLALLALLPRGGRIRIGWAVVTAGWAVVVGFAVWQMNKPASLAWIGEVAARGEASQRAMMETYLRTGGFSLENRETHPNVPHPAVTRMLLDDPRFRRVLPPSVVPALAVVPDPTRSRGFVRTEPSASGKAIVKTEGTADRERVLVSREINACGRPYLRLAVRGTVGEGAAELYAEDSAGERHDLLNLRVDSPDRFKTEHLAGGTQRFRLVARVPAGQELAFVEPVELGWLSYLVPKLLRFWPIVFWAGTALFLAGVIRWGRDRGATPKTV